MAVVQMFLLNRQYHRIECFAYYKQINIIINLCHAIPTIILYQYPMIVKQTQGYPLLVKGDSKILDKIKLVLTTTISMPKQIPVSVPFVPKYKQITPLLEPIIHLEIIDDIARQNIIKKNYQLKHETFYIYFPSQFRVDQKIYKSLNKQYENLLDEAPRAIKPYVQKFIMYQQGKGEHSIQAQKYKINQSLSAIAKQLIQSKLQSLSSEIKQHQSQASTPKSLHHIFLLKNKLACLYSHLELNEFASDLLNDVWNQLMNNFRVLMKLPPSLKLSQKLDIPADIPRSPYIFVDTKDILGYFQNNQSTAYLRIVTHAFMNCFMFYLELRDYFQAVFKLKFFLDFVLNNVLVLARKPEWTKQQSTLFDIARNLWVIEVALKCLNLFQEYKQNKGDAKRKIEQFNKVHVSVCSMLRNSVERVGTVLYKFDNYSIFPGSVQKQLQFIVQKINKIKQPWKTYKKSLQQIRQQQNQQFSKTASFYKRQQFKIQVPEQGPGGLKLRQLLSKKSIPPEEISKVLISFQAYTQVYLKVLQIMYSSLKCSPFVRVAKSLKLTIERATIMLGDWENHQFYEDQPFQFKNCWPQLHAVQKLYRLFFIFVKFLANAITDKVLLQDQLCDVIKDEGLKDEKNSTLKIASLINQIVPHQVKCYLTVVQKLSVDKSLQGKIILKIQNFTHLINKASNLYMITNQQMLSQGAKKYKLNNISCREFRKCPKCAQQCSIMCAQIGQFYTQIQCNLLLQDTKQQAIFKIQQIQLQFKTQQNSEKDTSFYLKINQSIQRNLFKLNTPQFVNLTQGQQQVYSECWTPFKFAIKNLYENVKLTKIAAKIQLPYIQYSQNQQNGSHPNEQENIQISQHFYVTRKQEDECYNTNEPVSISLQRFDDKTDYIITVFIKSKRPQVISRNSKRRIQQHPINQVLSVEAVLESSKMKKQYSLICSTKNLVLRPLLSVQYFVVQTCQQFMITNLRDINLSVTEIKEPEKSKNQQYSLAKDESLSVQCRCISIAPEQFKKISCLISLNEWFNSQQLLQQKTNSFKIWYPAQHKYKLFQPIQVYSEIQGIINLPHIKLEQDNEGFEIIGKIHGQVAYTSENDKGLNVWLVPVKSGSLVLPEVWISGKRGIWANSLITNIQTQ